MTALTEGSKRICLSIHQDQYIRIVADPTAFRQCLDGMIAQYPELFVSAPNRWGIGLT
jgi:ribulose bisphosphate carboxylase small subunit